eukprot:Gb_12212 [translate_table: standard]
MLVVVRPLTIVTSIVYVHPQPTYCHGPILAGCQPRPGLLGYFVRFGSSVSLIRFVFALVVLSLTASSVSINGPASVGRKSYLCKSSTHVSYTIFPTTPIVQHFQHCPSHHANSPSLARSELLPPCSSPQVHLALLWIAILRSSSPHSGGRSLTLPQLAQHPLSPMVLHLRFVVCCWTAPLALVLPQVESQQLISHCQRFLKVPHVLSPQLTLIPQLQPSHEVKKFVFLGHILNFDHKGAIPRTRFMDYSKASNLYSSSSKSSLVQNFPPRLISHCGLFGSTIFTRRWSTNIVQSQHCLESLDYGVSSTLIPSVMGLGLNYKFTLSIGSQPFNTRPCGTGRLDCGQLSTQTALFTPIDRAYRLSKILLTQALLNLTVV